MNCPHCNSDDIISGEHLEWDFDTLKIKVDWKYFSHFCKACKRRFTVDIPEESATIEAS
jgi:transcription elongation factor Elf1